MRETVEGDFGGRDEREEETENGKDDDDDDDDYDDDYDDDDDKRSIVLSICTTTRRGRLGRLGNCRNETLGAIFRHGQLTSVVCV